MKQCLKGGKSLILSFVVIFGLALSGCWPLILGAGAVGGYAVSRDTIQGEPETSFDELWEASKEVVSVMGVITSESYELGRIKGIVNGAKITVTVLQLTSSNIRLQVKARKFLLPSSANAQNIFIEIMNKIGGGA